LALPRPTDPALCDVRPTCPASSACAPDRQAPCGGLEQRHGVKLGLCDRLEAIADSLPDRIDRHACLAIAAELLPAMREAQGYEEGLLFPVFALSPRAGSSIGRLRTQHVEDEAAAEELTEVLLKLGHGAPADNPEALGFMLRAFFEAMRRHIAFEREHMARSWTG